MPRSFDAGPCLAGPLGGFGLPVLSGVLFAFALPLAWPGRAEPFDPSGRLEVLGFFALVPLLVAVEGVPAVAVVLRSILAGSVALGIALYWVVIALARFGGLSPAASLGLLCLLALYGAAYWAGTLLAARLLRDHLRFSFALSLPLVWPAFERMRELVFSGLPLGELGQTLARSPSLVQVAALGGTPLVASLLAVWNGALAEAVIYGCRAPGALGSRDVRRGLAGAGVALGAALLFGLGWRAHLRVAQAAAPHLRVAIVQPNVDQRSKNLGRARRWQVLSRLLPLTEAAAQKGADLVVWPEAAYPEPFNVQARAPGARWPAPAPVDLQALPELRRLRRAGHASFLLSGTTLFRTRLGWRRTNTAWLVGPDLSALGVHHKVHLVPFGEWVPPGVFEWVRPLVPGMGIFVPGPRLSPLWMPWDDRPEVGLGETICYEALFPDLSARLVAKGATLLVNTSNDAWYGRSSAPHQLLAIATLRAVENGRALVRAANTGRSAVVGPDGVVREASAVGLAAGDVSGGGRPVAPAPLLLEASVPILRIRTPYQRLRVVLGTAYPLAATALITLAIVRRRRGMV